MIVLSSAYQQASATDDTKAKIDPDNKLYWRMNRTRLEGEIIRDSVLSVSGALNPRLGGKPVRVPIEQEVYDLIFTESERDGLWLVTAGEFEQHRRSLPALKEFTGQHPTPGAAEQAMAQAIAFQTEEAVVADSFVQNLYSGIGHRYLTQYRVLVLS